MLRTLDRVGEELSRWATSDIPRVPTGFSIFDDRSHGGIATGEVFMLLARTSVGKTWFAINVLNNNPQTPAVFFSLEMHARYILLRLAGVHADSGTRTIEQDLTASRRNFALEHTIRDFPNLQISDEPGQSFEDMVEAINDYEREQGVRPVLVIIDFLELVQSFGMNAVESSDQLTWGLKNFSRAADVAVIALHQVSRGDTVQGVKNQGHRPLLLTDARYGGEISADYVAGMYKPSMDPKMPPAEKLMRANDIRFQLLKNRSGGMLAPEGEQHLWTPTGRIQELNFEGPHIPRALEVIR